MASIVFQVRSSFRFEILSSILVVMQLPSGTIKPSDFEYVSFSGILGDIIRIAFSMKQPELETHNSRSYQCKAQICWKCAENVTPRKCIALGEIKLPQANVEANRKCELPALRFHP